jgi:hypothetical protein
MVPVRIIIAFVLAVVAMCCISLYCTAHGFILVGWPKGIYWAIVVVVALWFLKPGGKPTDIIGSIFCGIFWPVALSTMAIINLSFKVIPHNKYKWLDKDQNVGVI